MKLIDEIQEEQLQTKLSQFEQNYAKWTPQVRDLCAYFLNCYIEAEDKTVYAPLIGEQENGLNTIMGFLMAGEPVVIRSFAGTGKTVLMNMIYSLLDDEDRYQVEMGSPLALWYQTTKINNAKFIWFNEFQNSADNEEVAKALKLWGEGRAAHREVVDVVSARQGGNGTDEQVLNWHPFITSFAVGNKTAEKVWNDEFSRRVFEIYTDVSSKQTSEIIKAYLKKWAMGEKNVVFMRPNQINLLKYHIKKCISIREGLKGVALPGAEALVDGVPVTFVESRSAIKQLAKLIEGYAVYNYKERIITKDGLLLATPADVWYAFSTYGQMFVQKCLRMGMLSKDILASLPEVSYANQIIDPSSCLSVAAILRILKTNDLTISKPKLTTLLTELENNGLVASSLSEDGSKEKLFYKTGLGTFSKTINFKSVVEQSIKVVKEHFPDYSKEYIERYCTVPTVMHPTKALEVNIITGKTTPITDWWQ